MVNLVHHTYIIRIRFGLSMAINCLYSVCCQNWDLNTGGLHGGEGNNTGLSFFDLFRDFFCSFRDLETEFSSPLAGHELFLLTFQFSARLFFRGCCTTTYIQFAFVVLHSRGGSWELVDAFSLCCLTWHFWKILAAWSGEWGVVGSFCLLFLLELGV